MTDDGGRINHRLLVVRRLPSVLWLRTRCEAQVEVARFERVLVLAQGGLVGGGRYVEPGRQLPVHQPGAAQLLEARQVADRFQPEMGQESLGGPEGDRPARRLAPAARADTAGLEAD